MGTAQKHKIRRCSLRERPGCRMKTSIPFSRLSCVPFACLCMLCSASELWCSPQGPGSSCDAQSVFRLADAQLKRQKYDQAERELDRLLGCKALSSIDTFNLGWLYGRAHNFAKALSKFNSVSPDVPNTKTHQYAITLAQFELADYKAAVETLTSIERHDLDQDSVNLLAVSYSKLGLYRESYTVLTDEIHRHPDDRLAYLNLVTLLGDQGKLKDAVDIADEAVSAFPENAEVLVVRGAAQTLAGEIAGAQADFKAAIKASPHYGPPRFFLAVSQYKEGRYGDARDEILHALRAGVNDADLHYLLAEVMLRIDPGNTDNALAELNHAIVMNPREVQALSLRGKLRLQQHDLTGAIPDLELAHSIDPASASAAYNLARAYFDQGKEKEANALSKQLASSGTDAVNELNDQKIKSALGLPPMNK
jgi:tetratricopeptide (TPR) repeat protein